MSRVVIKTHVNSYHTTPSSVVVYRNSACVGYTQVSRFEKKNTFKQDGVA